MFKAIRKAEEIKAVKFNNSEDCFRELKELGVKFETEDKYGECCLVLIDDFGERELVRVGGYVLKHEIGDFEGMDPVEFEKVYEKK